MPLYSSDNTHQQWYVEASAWVCQLVASVSWIVCVVIYDSWDAGDAFQMLAAAAWTLSNLLSLPCMPQPQPEQQKGGDTEGGKQGSSSADDKQWYMEASAWGLQMCASLAWFVCMFIYDSFAAGDILQILASSAWTISNLLSLPKRQTQRQQEEVRGIAATSALTAGEGGSSPERMVGKGGERSDGSGGSDGEQGGMSEVAAWAFQMFASLAWIVSVVLYDSWQTGDAFQMLAASAWTVSNLLSLPDGLSCEEPAGGGKEGALDADTELELTGLGGEKSAMKSAVHAAV